MTTKKLRSERPAARVLSLLIALVLVSSPLWAEDVYVTSCVGTVGTSTLNSCPPSCPLNRGTTTLTSSVSSAPGIPGRNRAAFAVSPAASWEVTPTLSQNSGVYRIYVTKGTSGNGSPDLIVSLTTTNGGDLADASSVGTNVVMLTSFQATAANNAWTLVGYLTNITATPTVVFTYVSGAAAATGGRWYMDAVRFENLDPCTGVAPLAEATGPLAAGQTFVNVTGVAAGATNVTVFADAIEIGQTNFAAGFAAGAITVPTGALVKDSTITATQTKTNSAGGACTSQPASSGPLVGGGSNPKISLALGVLQNAALTGPAGANTGGAGTGYWLKATDTVAGASATAPVGGAPLVPGQCWQTITFSWATDAGLNWQSSVTLTDANPFAALEHLAFAIDDLDSGPCDIYVDSIKNGDTVIEDFEGYTNGAPATFLAPNAATVPNPGPNFLSSPNSSGVSQNYAFDGTNACRVQWQFRDTADSRWVRLLAGSALGKRFPQLDTRKPVTMHLLVLPVGTTVDKKFNGTVNDITNSGTGYVTTTNILSVGVTGSGTYTYQWTLNGGALPNISTESTYVIDGAGTGASAADNGIYMVEVSDGNCTEKRIISFTARDPIPTITNQPAQRIINQGDTVAVMSVGADGHIPAGYPLTYQWRTDSVDISDQTLDTLWITNASLADVLGYEVVVANTYGSVTSSIATVDVVPVGIVAGTGTGLRADYRTLHFSTNAFSGTPTRTRTDATVNFDWGSFGSPDPSVSADFFTARWTGQVQALGDDTYTFSTISDDGVRLWVNGQQLVNNWTLHGPTTDSGVIALTGTNKYDLTMEFFENAVGAVAKLYWSSASGTVGFEPVPRSQLYPAPAGTAIPVVTHSQPDATHITFNWGVGTYNLAWSTNVAGPYDNIIYGVTSPHTETIGSEPQKYFRLLVE